MYEKQADTQLFSDIVNYLETGKFTSFMKGKFGWEVSTVWKQGDEWWQTITKRHYNGGTYSTRVGPLIVLITATGDHDPIHRPFRQIHRMDDRWTVVEDGGAFRASFVATMSFHKKNMKKYMEKV
jgi:hypothetical protein